MGFSEGIASDPPDATSQNSSSGELSDSTLDSIQQNYEGVKSTFLDYAIWLDNLSGDRKRPFLDVHLIPFTTAIRLPVVSNAYDVYADKGTFYEDVSIQGSVSIGGGITGKLSIGGEASFSRSIESITSDRIISISDKSKILHIKPTGESVKLILPVTNMESGFFIEVVNCTEGKYTTLEPEQGELKAKGTGLSQPYSAATVYWDGSQWYAIGDLTT